MFTNTNGNNGWNKSTGFSGLGSNNNGSSNTGLFGNSGTSTGLFGNSGQRPFSSSNNASSNNTSTFNNSTGGGLFNTTQTGNSGPGTGGLFGTANTTNTGINSNPNTNTNGTSHPYVNSSVFQGVPSNYEMPASITGDIFTSKAKPQKRPRSTKKPNTSSIFSRIFTGLNIFKSSQQHEFGNPSDKIFTSSEFPSTRVFLGSKTKPKNKVTKPIAFNSIEARSSNETKKLIIKSKPLKFHLIDADKVLNSKKKRVITTLVSSDKLLNAEEDDSDYEISNTTIDREHPAKRSRLLNNMTQGPHFESSNTSNVQTIQEDGYWCSPAITELDTWSLKDLSSIENFIIGRKGYGQVAFSQAVDLSELKRKCNEEDKPFSDQLFYQTVEIGSKYVKVYKDDENKPSRGFGMNVPATITLENIEPTGGKDLSSFINLLKNKPGMEFVTYDPIMFVWIFKVGHFSVWGLVDDNEDEFTRELKKQRINNETTGLPGNWGVTNEPLLDIKKRLLDSEIDSQIDLYGESPSNRLSVTKNDNILDDIEDKEETPRIRENYEYLRQLVSVLPANVDLSEIVQEKAYEPEITDKSAFDLIQPRPNIAVSDDWLVQLELTNDLNSSLAQYLSNRKLKFEDQGKLKLESVDELLFSNLNQSAESSKEVSTPSGDTDDVKMSEPIESEQEFTQDITKILPQLLENTTFSSRKSKNGFSHAVIDHSSFSDYDLSGVSSSLSDVLQLSSCLFDNIQETPSKQRQALINWLKKYTKPTTDELLANSSDEFERILVYLCVGDIKSAVSAGLQSKNHHLSAILTLADSRFGGLAEVAKSQIEEWNNNGYIPNNLIKIYQFLAGQYDTVLKEFPWQIQLICKVYYEPPETSLNAIIDTVIEDLDESHIIVDLLKYYTSSTEGTPNANALSSPDFSIFFKWVIFSILNKNIDDNTTLRLGDLTDQLGLWKESLYIYSHLINDLVAEKSITKVIKTHIKEIKDEKTNIDEEPYLVSTLRVPSNLIYESVATEMNSAKEYWKACDAYMTAHSWTKAHECIAENLGPTIVVSKDILDIRRLQRILAAFPDGGNIIPKWSQGAGIFQHYFNLLPYIREAKTPVSNKEIVESLLDNLPSLNVDDSLTSRVALAIISRDIGNLAIDLKVQNARDRILKLPLDEDGLNYFQHRI